MVVGGRRHSRERASDALVGKITADQERGDYGHSA